MAPTASAGAPSRPPRRDAVRNRRLLVAAAADAFREEGLEVGVDAIARRAGVGVATLYRHFPAKNDLVLAVTEALVDGFADAARRAIDDGPQGTLEAVLRSSLAQQRENRGFFEALAQRPRDPELRARITGRVLPVLEDVAAAGHRAGELRAELGGADLLVVLRMLGAAGATPDPERYLGLLLRGMAPPRAGA